tara:strand:+ start:275 stop:1261 length:987 start_codon:yes stop_codon:yes gene_type:complete
MAELPDVGSIQPLTLEESRKAFGTPITRALKIDPISMEKSPIKRGIASIGSNIMDMLPGFSFQKGMEEGDPLQMGFGVVDLIPQVALLKVGSKPVIDLANKLARMAPEEIAAIKKKYNKLFREIYDEQERIRNSRGAEPADVADVMKKQKALKQNHSILFDNAGKKFDVKKNNAKIAKENKKRLKDHPDFEDNPDALDEFIQEFEGEELFDMGDYIGPERDFPNIPLSYNKPNLSRMFLKEQNFRNLDEIGYARPPKYSPEDISQQNTSNWFEEIGENKYRLYEFNPQTGRYTQTTLDNPDLATWRNFLGYAKGGQVEKNTNNNQKLI